MSAEIARPLPINNALLRAGLSDRSESFVEELSFGLKQRLVLAKTLLHQPRVLLLDEPATGLDPIARLELRRELQQLNAEGVTIMISSHILSDLEDICTRVALISGGRNATDAEGNPVIHLRQAGNPAQIYEVELLEQAADVSQLAVATNIKVLRAEGSRLIVEIVGGKNEAAALLRRLVTSGIDVVKFQQQTFSLEDLYRKAFGGEQS
jgi:ABC-2 type transport system ATP-binding protein